MPFRPQATTVGLPKRLDCRATPHRFPARTNREVVAPLSECSSLEDGDPEVFLLALRDIARARGGVAKLAEATQLNREHLYRMLSESGLAVTLKEAS